MTAPCLRAAAIAALVSQLHPPLSPADTDIHDDMLLSIGGLGLTSVGLLQAFVEIEGQFGFTFDDAAVFQAEFNTVGDFVSFLEKVGPPGRVPR